jgi:hypothetical protein
MPYMALSLPKRGQFFTRFASGMHGDSTHGVLYPARTGAWTVLARQGKAAAVLRRQL